MIVICSTSDDWADVKSEKEKQKSGTANSSSKCFLDSSVPLFQLNFLLLQRQM